MYEGGYLCGGWLCGRILRYMLVEVLCCCSMLGKGEIYHIAW